MLRRDTPAPATPHCGLTPCDRRLLKGFCNLLSFFLTMLVELG